MNGRKAWAVLFLFALAAALAAFSLFWTADQVHGLRAAVRASCAFAADLGGAPFPSSPAKVSRLGVSIVADSRSQWHALGCPGHLAPPAPSFVMWARYYHLPDK